MEKIGQFFKRLFGIDDRLTEQESLIRDIVTDLLDRKDTNKVMYNSTCCYLSNIGMGVEAAIDGDDVIIKSGQEIITVRCSSRFMMTLSDTVDKSVERNVSNLYREMFDYQTSTLDRIRNRVEEIPEIEYHDPDGMKELGEGEEEI